MASTPPPNAAIGELAEVVGLEDARDLVRTFLKEYNGLVRAMTAEDPKLQHRAVHSLKSSCRHMGLDSMVRRLQALEARLLLPEGKVTLEDIAVLDREFERVAVPLRQFTASR